MKCDSSLRGLVFLTLVLIPLTVNAESTEDNAGQLARIVNELQSQVLALQEARNQDQATIRNLQDKLQKHFGGGASQLNIQTTSTTFSSDSEEAIELPPARTTSPTVADLVITRVLTNRQNSLTSLNLENSGETKLDTRYGEHLRAIDVLERESQSLKRLDRQLRELRSDIGDVVKIKERDITATENVAEFRQEAESLRDELLRVKREVEEVRTKRREEDLASKKVRNSQVTTQWLQKTVEDLRREMTELASSVNVSAALGQRQKDQAGLDLARSDITDLRRRLDAVHVAQERDAAWVSQMRQDLAELRLKLQDMATGHQRLVHEVAELKEELKEKATVSAKEQETRTEKGPVSHHQMRHRGHWQVEIGELQKHMKVLKDFQNTFKYEIRVLKDSQGDLTGKVSNLEIVSTDLVNRSTHLGVEQHAMSRQMESIQHQMDQQERQSSDLKSTVNNITETGIKKLHASTIQLFKTLENLEDNYDETMEDIRKEMSKMEFNLAQAQSTLRELREEQSTYDQTLKSMRTEVKRVQMESKRDHYRLLSLRSDVINKTLQDTRLHHEDAVREIKITDLESKIASLSKAVDGERQEVDILHKQVAEKADTTDLSRWERTQDRLREIVLNISGVIPRMTKEEELLHNEMGKFIKQLPKDCSMVDKAETKSKSGVYLIQAPATNTPSHAATTRVFCDMDTAGGHWLVIQRRQNGRQNFNQNWVQYKEGFGDVDGDFWLGNELVHRLTTNGDYKLRIDLWDATGRYKYVEYQTFRVLQESDGYRLAIGGYSGNGSDTMGYHNGMAFSTPDRDNDASIATHCGQFYGSGWWYNHCQYVNINGRYSTGVTWYDIDGQEWSELTRVEMKIKPVKKKTST